MAKVTVEHNMTANSAFAKAMERMTAKKTEMLFEVMRQELADEANDLIEELLFTDRDPTRRKKGAKGGSTLRMANSMRARVETTNGGFPITLHLASRANQKKVASLEYGSKPHEIHGNPWLYFPNTRDAGRQRAGIYGKYGSASGGGKAIKTTKAAMVNHPGHQPGYKFMRTAIKRVADRHLSGARL